MLLREIQLYNNVYHSLIFYYNVNISKGVSCILTTIASFQKEKMIEPAEQVQYEGRSISIKCKGYVLQWLFNGFSVPDDVIVNRSELHIKNVNILHAGKYRCYILVTDLEATWETSILRVGG